MNFKIGCDPEIFVMGPQGNLRSIIGKIGGSKLAPLPLFHLGEGFAVQEDNVALEFNIPASDSKQIFVDNVGRAMEMLEHMVGDMHGLKFCRASAASFPEEELQDPRAFEFGCEPDYNAWTGKMNPKPKAEDPNLRSAGGHVHVGYKLNKKQKQELVRYMDLVLSVPAQYMDVDGEVRKRLYGKAGACRYKSYGVEYRSLSNFWVFSPRLREWVYDNTERALVAVLNGESVASEKDNILAAVDGGDRKVAHELIQKYNLEVVYA